MALLNLKSISFTFGGPQLLGGVDLSIDRGERIGLVGRNGAGKSTLLKLLAGEIEPDDGQIRRENDLQPARLVQEVPQDTHGQVADIVRCGWIEHADAAGHGEDWRFAQALQRVLSRMSLDGDWEFDTLSSGMKRRVLLAQALVRDPQVLLLDEPTNHLDIDSIAWLEGFLKHCDATLVFVTHDRVFLQALATRIVEIDRGRLLDWTCDYATFVHRKQQQLAAEEKRDREFDRKLAEEEVWIRQGIKARRTRNEGRVRALKKLREERRQRRECLGNVRMQAAAADKSGRLVIETDRLCFGYDERHIVDDLSVLISRGEKIGIIGPNGSGKTTLLKLLLGEIEPTSGSIRHGVRLQTIYFDQLREQLDEEQNVVENVGEGQQTLLIDGRDTHIYGYLQDFLFTPERARTAVKFLSGGERNRLLLARLFKRPSNLMVLDEPTNDLDAETLELLEELVVTYSGTLLLVSHDRAFLNNVVTGTLALDGTGAVHEYDGGYDDYLRQRAQASPGVPSTPDQPGSSPLEGPARTGAPAKLSYTEQRELDSLPAAIESLETERSELHAAMSAPAFFKQDGAEIGAATARLQSLEEQLSELYTRWEQLEERT